MESKCKGADSNEDEIGENVSLLSPETISAQVPQENDNSNECSVKEEQKNVQNSKYKVNEVTFAINYLDDIQVRSPTSDSLKCASICEKQVQRPNSAETRALPQSSSPVKAINRNISIESAASSSTNKRSNKNLPKHCKFTPPDGGWGWVVVFSSFMISVIADGISFSFGILFVDLTDYFKAGKSKTALVGSLFFSIPLLIGPLASALTDHFGCRKVTIVSGIIASIGFIIGYFANSLEHLFIAFSISGIGLSLSYVTSIVIVAYYFEKRRSLATGLAVCGTGIGTFVCPPLTIFLLQEYTWRGTLLIMAGFFLNIVVCGCLMRDLDFDEETTESSCDYDSDTPSISNDNNAQTFNANNGEGIESRERGGNSETNQHSSLIAIPTYISNRNGSCVPSEVFTEMGTRKGGYLWQLMQRYPNLISAFLAKDDKSETKINSPSRVIAVHNEPLQCKFDNYEDDTNSKANSIRSPNRQQLAVMNGSNRTNSGIPFESGAYLRNIRLQRGRQVTTYLLRLTYRSAMLNIRRYRLRASSAPDIYRNSMVTIDTSEHLNNFLHDIKDILLDIVDLSIFKSFKYTTFCISNLLLYACIDIPYVYIPDHAISTGSSDKEIASFFISVIGVVNTLGIVIVGYFGDKPWLEAPTLYSVLITIGGISIAFIPWVHSYISLAVLAAIYGFAISANYSLVSVILVDIISLDRFTNAYGLLLLVQGIASLAGPPIAGWLYDLTGNYDATFYTTGVCILISGILVVPVAKTDRCYALQKATAVFSGVSSNSKFQITDPLKPVNGSTSTTDGNK